MASLAQLMKYGSIGTSGGFDFKLDIPSNKFRWDDKRLKRKVGEARAKALRAAGLVVRDRTKRQISSRAPRKVPVRMTVGSRFDLKLVALVNRVPKSDRITSWQTTRFPKGMLRQDIQSDYDNRSKSVVIGPAKFPALNQLQEKGGTSRRWFKPVPQKAPQGSVFGVLTNTIPREKSRWVTINGRNRRRRGREITSSFSFQIRIKPRAYMAKGLAKARPRIPQEFLDTIQGP
jgi:hypothetical protein